MSVTSDQMNSAMRRAAGRPAAVDLPSDTPLDRARDRLARAQQTGDPGYIAAALEGVRTQTGIAQRPVSEESGNFDAGFRGDLPGEDPSAEMNRRFREHRHYA